MGTQAFSFAVLSENRRWRFAVFFLLYIAQGIPLGLLWYAVPAYLAMRGTDAAEIAAFLSLFFLPHGIKLVNGPIMDRLIIRDAAILARRVPEP